MDFTMGSGTTGVAALRNDRIFIGVEMDTGYFEDAVYRIHLADNTNEIDDIISEESGKAVDKVIAKINKVKKNKIKDNVKAKTNLKMNKIGDKK